MQFFLNRQPYRTSDILTIFLNQQRKVPLSFALWLLQTGLFVLLSMLVVSCEKDKTIANNPNYLNPNCWAASSVINEKEVDVFYVYPTLFGGIGEMNMDIFDEEMRLRVQSVILKQTSLFSGHCNVYVPYYRQMAMDGLAKEAVERNSYYSIGRGDIEKAFDFYLRHLNKGRPFILAGHSQGSQILIDLMKTKFHQPDLRNQLVAAYLIGYSVTDSDLMAGEWMKFATSDQDFGVIISYNTQSEEACGSPVLLENAKCINPLNWKTTSDYAPKELNLGAVFFSEGGEIDSLVYQFTDAWIDAQGALVAGNPDVNTYSTANFPEGVYHKYDYSFFYNNLKKNVGVRIGAYFNNQ